MGLASDGESLFIADRSNHRVQKVRLRDGQPLASIAGSGGGSGGLWGPYGLALFQEGRGGRRLLLVADANNSRLATFDAIELNRLGVSGGHGDGPRQLDRPRGVAVTDVSEDEGAKGAGEAFVADFGNDRVQVFAVGGRGHGGHQRSLYGAGLRRPYGVAVGGRLLFVSEWAGKRVQALPAAPPSPPHRA